MNKNNDRKKNNDIRNNVEEEAVEYKVNQIDFSTINPVTAGNLSGEDYVAYLKYCLERSEDDLKNGRYCTLEEAEKEMEALYESYNTKRSKRKH